jgi:hypothetical protein
LRVFRHLREWAFALAWATLSRMDENLGRLFLSGPKCRGTLAATLSTPPAALALICPNVVRREWMALAPS